MAQVIDYDYIEEISTLDAGRNLASDTTNWYTQDLPWVNTFLINAQNQAFNFPDSKWIAWWSTNVSWSSSSYNSISWSSWKVFLPDWTEINISSWSASLSATTYIYVDQQDGTVYYTTSAADSVWDNKILLCVAAPTTSWKACTFQAFGSGDQSTFITASNIAANTITGNEIYANSIWANQIASGAITTNKIAVNAVWTNQIDDWAVTADKIYVSTLSAITANLWDVTVWTTTSWSSNKSWIRIYPSNSNWYMTFYYNKNQVWEIAWWYNSDAWKNVISISWDNIAFGWNVYCFYPAYFGYKLRIPVWTNLY